MPRSASAVETQNHRCRPRGLGPVDRGDVARRECNPHIRRIDAAPVRHFEQYRAASNADSAAVMLLVPGVDQILRPPLQHPHGGLEMKRRSDGQPHTITPGADTPTRRDERRRCRARRSQSIQR